MARQDLSTFLLLAVALALTVAVSHGCSSKGGEYAQQIKVLESADVAADVKNAVSKGDLRFVGVMGVGLLVPGVPDYQEKYAARYGVRVIENTSDAIENEEHRRLQDVAYHYAEKYNSLLIPRLPKN